MGTRGTYGFRKNGEDKLTYNHFDSYPDWLGRNVIEFCQNHSVEEINEIFDKIVMVNEKTDKPTTEQIKECVENGFVDLNVSTQSETDWYCLLRNCQGDLECLANTKDHAYMIDDGNFIKDSLFCEYGYIINLDEDVIEYYEGFQKKPQEWNRYGTTPNENGYYPCKLVMVFPLNEIDDVDKNLKMMQYGEDYDDITAAIENNPNFDLIESEAKELGDKKIIGLWENIEDAAESEARENGVLTDENERYFNLELYGEDLLDNLGWLEFESTGRVVFYEY